MTSVQLNTNSAYFRELTLLTAATINQRNKKNKKKENKNASGQQLRSER